MNHLLRNNRLLLSVKKVCYPFWIWRNYKKFYHMSTFYKYQLHNDTSDLWLVFVDRVAIKCFKSKIWKYFGTVEVTLQIFKTLFFLLVLIGTLHILVAEVCFLTKKDMPYFLSAYNLLKLVTWWNLFGLVFMDLAKRELYDLSTLSLLSIRL